MSRLDIRPSLSPGADDPNVTGDQLFSFPMPNASDRSNAGTEIALTKKPARILALDFTKGVLVLFMVIYHWMNYLVVADGSVYKYLRFLTPSFIFITGFLISHVYLSKYETSGMWIPKRLLLRGLKLLGIVLCLNIAQRTLLPRTFATRLSEWSPGDIVVAYLTGTASVAFAVLVPIAYLLILSAGLLIVSRYYRHICHVACAVFVASAFLFELKGRNGGYLQILSIGVLGISVGYIHIDRINSFVKRRLAMASAYLAYLSAITLWGDIYVLQIVGVCLSLAVIYQLGLEDAEPNRVCKALILLGQYSLFAYIAQIVILQILQKSLGALGAGIAASGSALLVSAACTVLCVEVVDRARRRMTGFNKLYSAVFS